MRRICGSISVSFTAAFVCPGIYRTEEISQKEEVMLSIGLLDHSQVDGHDIIQYSRSQNFVTHRTLLRTCCEKWRHKELLSWQHYRSSRLA